MTGETLKTIEIILTPFIAGLPFIWERFKDKKPLIYNVLKVSFFLLISLFAFVDYQNSSIENTEKVDAKNESIKAKDELIKAKVELASELKTERDTIYKVLKQTIKIMNLQTGGNSFPLAGLMPVSKWDNLVFDLKNKGVYPLNDLTMAIVDVDLWNKGLLEKDRVTKSAILHKCVIFNRSLGNMRSGVHFPFSITPETIEGLKERNFKIDYTASNYDFIQWVKVREKNGKILFATKVEIEKTHQVLYKKVTDGFLNIGEKKVVWTDYSDRKELDKTPE